MKLYKYSISSDYVTMDEWGIDNHYPSCKICNKKIKHNDLVHEWHFWNKNEIICSGFVHHKCVEEEYGLLS